MFSSFGVKELLIILLIAALIFGTKKLRNMGGDLGDAVRGFRKAMRDDDETDAGRKKDDATAHALEDKSENRMSQAPPERQHSNTAD